jgi:thiosulfate/3-mercaptopyruvate sulfurtransferase
MSIVLTMGINMRSVSCFMTILFLAAPRFGRAWIGNSIASSAKSRSKCKLISKWNSQQTYPQLQHGYTPAQTSLHQAQPEQPDITLDSNSDSNLLSLDECLELYREDSLASSSSSSNSSNNSRVHFADGSWYHKGERNGRTDFEAGSRIPGSIYFDVTDICTSQDLTGLFAMLPGKELFAAACTAWNIREQDHVIIYGREGSAFTPRVWFTWKHAMGHAGQVSLMQASLEEWMAAGGPVDDEQGASVLRAQDLDVNQDSVYRADSKNYNNDNDNDNQDPSCVADLEEVMGWVSANSNSDNDNDNDTIIVDARGSSFQKGHIPGAVHIPYSTLTDPSNPLRLLPPAQLREIFSAAGVDTDTDQRIVCSCGSGVSACSLYLALQECGRTGETLMYDGSWNEWGSHPDTPKILSEKRS